MAPGKQPPHDEDDNRRIMERLEEIGGKLDRIEKFVTGDHEPEKGLLVRIDRIEQADITRRWWTQTAVGAAITAVVTSVWSIFAHK